jgi:hypothetical protein
MPPYKRNLLIVAVALLCVAVWAFVLLWRDHDPDSLEAITLAAHQRGLHAIANRADGLLSSSEVLIVSDKPIVWDEVYDLTVHNVEKRPGLVLVFMPGARTRKFGLGIPSRYAEGWRWGSAYLLGDTDVVTRLAGRPLTKATKD